MSTCQLLASDLQLDDPALIRIEDAAFKYGLSEFNTKRLRGSICTDLLNNPIGDVYLGLVRDDWRLEKFVANLRVQSKSKGES